MVPRGEDPFGAISHSWEVLLSALGHYFEFGHSTLLPNGYYCGAYPYDLFPDEWSMSGQEELEWSQRLQAQKSVLCGVWINSFAGIRLVEGSSIAAPIRQYEHLILIEQEGEGLIVTGRAGCTPKLARKLSSRPLFFPKPEVRDSILLARHLNDCGGEVEPAKFKSALKKVLRSLAIQGHEAPRQIHSDSPYFTDFLWNYINPIVEVPYRSKSAERLVDGATAVCWREPAPPRPLLEQKMSYRKARRVENSYWLEWPGCSWLLAIPEDVPTLREGCIFQPMLVILK